MTSTSRIALTGPELQPYLKRYSAKFHPDVSNNKRHIYYSHPSQKWIKVKAVGGKYLLTFHTACPCSHED